MRGLNSPTIVKTEVLVIGGGGAGLRAAIEARNLGAEVLLVSKARAGYDNNTAISGSLLAAAASWTEPKDTPEAHFKDTLIAGRFLNDQRLVEVMVEGAEREVRRLQSFGIDFRKKRDSNFRVLHRAGHSYPRHIFGARRALGIELTKPLRQQAAKLGVQLKERIQITRLLVRNGVMVGALGFNEAGGFFIFQAKAVILATGGAGKIYLRTDNATGSTGDGYALAYKAGAVLQDMEFVQFYPTATGEFGSRIWPYESFLPRGGALRNSMGEDILEKGGIRDAISMTRDVLSQVMMTEILEGRGIENALLADLSALGRGTLEKIYVAPTAHHFMGGLRINDKCETSVPGLYAAGEVCGGIHGANRLAGNALTDIFVFGALAGKNAAQRASQVEVDSAIPDEANAEIERLQSLCGSQGQGAIKQLQRQLRETMWHQAGIIRDKNSLEQALRELHSLRPHTEAIQVNDPRDLTSAIELSNMVLVAEMICQAALMREESRGAHLRTDYREENNSKWLRHVLIFEKEGKVSLSSAPVDLYRLKPA